MSAENAICIYGNRITPRLVDLLTGKDNESRCRVISALTRIGDRKAIEPIERLVENAHENQRVINLARMALKMLKGETGREPGHQTMPLC